MPDKQIFSGDPAFGERLRYLREKAGLSQTAFAEKLGYKRSSSISNIETGKTPPDIRILQKIATSFDTNLHWLITGKSSPDGDAWKTSYSELLRMYHSDVGPFIERLEAEIKDLTKKATEIQERESRGETVNPFELEMISEKLRPRQSSLDKIKVNLKQAFERCGGIRLEG
jgi:transcriptional regulator with XRE-family HTH domain